MTTLIRMELLKLRTTRLSYGLLLTAAGLTLGFSLLEATRAGTRGGAPLSTAACLNAVITGGTLALLLAIVLGVTVSSGEFRHGTATATYLAVPQRNRVLAAKCVAAAGAVASDGSAEPIGAATMARYAAGHVLAGALLAAIGAGLGSLIRSQLAAVMGVFVWGGVIEAGCGGFV